MLLAPVDVCSVGQLLEHQLPSLVEARPSPGAILRRLPTPSLDLGLLRSRLVHDVPSRLPSPARPILHLRLDFVANLGDRLVKPVDRLELPMLVLQDLEGVELGFRELVVQQKLELVVVGESVDEDS